MNQPKFFGITCACATLFLITLLALSGGCAEQQTPDGELVCYANAEGSESSRGLDSSAISFERGFHDNSSAQYLLRFNATVTADDACGQVTYEAMSDNIRIAIAPGAWSDSVTVPKEKAEAGLFLFFNVTTESSQDYGEATALSAFSDSELLVSFTNSTGTTSYLYRTTPTTDYLAAINASGNSENPTEAFHGTRFIMEKRPLNNSNTRHYA